MQAHSRFSTVADLLYQPQTDNHELLYNLSLILGGSLLIALLAQVAIPLPFTPVPITGQTLGVLLVGMLLGSRRGALSVVAYLAEGSLGMPFFAAGKAGAAVLAGATGGYLIGFIFAAALVGWLAERGWDRGFLTTTLAMSLGTAVIFLCGLVWLSTLLGLQKALAAGLYPFLPGALVKIAIAAVVLPTGWKLLGKRSEDPA